MPQTLAPSCMLGVLISSTTHASNLYTCVSCGSRSVRLSHSHMLSIWNPSLVLLQRVMIVTEECGCSMPLSLT